MADMQAALLSFLECSACPEFMLPPIRYCENAHSLCNECGCKTGNCPTCMYPILDLRNTALENLAASLMIPCKYRHDGCRTLSKMEDLIQHQMDCIYGKFFTCPWKMEIGKSCDYRGSYSEMKRHFRIHKIEVHTVHDDVFVGVIPKKPQSNAHQQIIQAMGTLFMILWEWNHCDTIFSIFHLGMGMHGKFRYVLDVHSPISTLPNACERRILNIGEKMVRYQYCRNVRFQSLNSVERKKGMSLHIIKSG